MSDGGEQVVVISDLHANARALRAALAQAKAGGCDRLIILGDLLTYGLDIAETLDLVAAEQARGADLVIGNHDQLYFDLDDGRGDYYGKLPDWLRESVDHTRAQLAPGQLRRGLRWVTEVVLGPVLLAHANPFPFGDWTYLNAEPERARARARIAARGKVLGIFGHNHRALIEPSAAPGSAALANPGSIGQPRSSDGRSTLLRLVLGAGGPRDLAIEPVVYDEAAHVAALRQAPLSEPTISKLCSFFSAC